LGHLIYVIFSAYLFIYLKRPYLFIVRIIEQMNSDWIFRNKGWILSSFFFNLNYHISHTQIFREHTLQLYHQLFWLEAGRVKPSYEKFPNFHQHVGAAEQSQLISSLTLNNEHEHGCGWDTQCSGHLVTAQVKSHHDTITPNEEI